MNVFADTIRDLRRDRGISQEELARMASVSRHTIVQVEKPDENPRLETLAAVLGALGLQLAARPIPETPFAESGYDASRFGISNDLFDKMKREAEAYAQV